MPPGAFSDTWPEIVFKASFKFTAPLEPLTEAVSVPVALMAPPAPAAWLMVPDWVVNVRFVALMPFRFVVSKTEKAPALLKVMAPEVVAEKELTDEPPIESEAPVAAKLLAVTPKVMLPEVPD